MPSQLPAVSDEPYSLPAHYYRDSAIFARELEQVFYRSWNFVGYTSQLANPGDYITCRVGEENLIVVSGNDRKPRAFFNVCRHRAHELLTGSGHVSAITCPYHAWSYETDGRLRYARNSDKVHGFDAAEFCLKGVKLEVFCAMVFVNLDQQATSLGEQAPGLEAELRAYEPRLDNLTLTFRRELVIESNWKNVVDNYNENYHTPVVHPVLNSILDENYRVFLKGLYIAHVSGVNTGTTGGFDVEGTGYKQHLNWWLWPNLCIMSFPEGGFRVLHIVPDGPERVRETYDFYLPYADPSPRQWEQILYACDTINAEDIGVCESIQRGLASRSFSRARIMVDPEDGWWNEHAVLHFKNLILDAIG